MIRKTSAFIVILSFALVGCGVGEDSGSGGSGGSSAAVDDGTLECALAGAAEFTKSCDVERLSNNDGQQMIFRHPDGGFRRFLVVTDGRALIAADGADDAKVTIIGENRIEVQVDDDRYQLPARVAGKDAG